MREIGKRGKFCWFANVIVPERLRGAKLSGFRLSVILFNDRMTAKTLFVSGAGYSFTSCLDWTNATGLEEEEGSLVEAPR